LLAIAVLPKHYRSVLAESDTWVVMLVYSITFGGFVGMSSYVTTLLVSLYQLPKLEAGSVHVACSRSPARWCVRSAA
jgi:NNP family nitrate/nitrite transporter-like MFS transporter